MNNRLPMFNAELSLDHMSNVYRARQMFGDSVKQPRMLMQAKYNETFIITPTSCCYCYYDTDEAMSICECDPC
jgi:hypothetical protein